MQARRFVDTPKRSTRGDIEAALETLTQNAKAWTEASIEEYLNQLKACRKGFADVAEAWVMASQAGKRIPAGHPGEADEWLGGPYAILRNIYLLEQTLQSLRTSGKPKLPGQVSVNRHGNLVAPVFPTDIYDRLFFMGTTAEVWMQSGVTPENLAENMAHAYRQPVEPGVSLVLGGGNVSSIGPMDALYKLFIEKKTVIIKMHPVNGYTGPLLEQACKGLIDAGVLAVVYGDAEEGAFLCHHQEVSDIHITGSDRTHDVIVFGQDVEARKRARDPLLQKPITSELGNVSPVIIVPGQWSASDIDFQASNIVSSLANNGGFNCNASRVLVMAKHWSQREQLLDAIAAKFRALPTRDAYYPGAHQRHKQFVDAHPDALQIGEADERRLPWTLIKDVDPANSNDICFQMEAFCSVFCEVALEADSNAEFIHRAVAFANDTLWGTLNATMIVHPSSLKVPETNAAFEQAVADLHFGTVAINHWAAIGYAMVSPTWGAYPCHDIYDIKSGLDVVHNTYMFDKPLKSVVRGPFKPWPKPAWFATNKKGITIGKRLVDFQAEPSPTKLPGIFMNAMLG